MRTASALFAVVVTACIRNPKDLPGAQEGGFVEGVVVEQSLATGDVAGVAGALITELSTQQRITADAEGRFIMERLPIGRNLYLEVRKSLAPSSPIRRLPPLKILVDGHLIDLDQIRLGENGSLEGRALLEQEDGAIAGAGGTLVVIATTPFQGITSEDGTFSIPSVPEGTFDVVAFRPGFQAARVSGVPIAPALTTRTRDLIMTPGEPPTVQVAGTARLSGSDTHDGIEVLFTSEVDPAFVFGPVTTGADGRYELPVQAGVYRARFAKAGHVSVELAGVAVLEEGVVGLFEVTLVPGEDSDPADDSDGDGITDDLDPDDDADGLVDAEELSIGLDGWVTDPLQADTDGDGVRDDEDNCPTVSNLEQDRRACIGRSMPEITGLSRLSGGTGSSLAIFGSNFVAGDPFTSVRFGAGASVSVPDLIVAPDRVDVVVPRGAESGPISIYTGGQVATSSQTFTFIPPPRILRVVPGSARPNARFAIVGRAIENGNVFIGGVSATTRTCGPDEGEPDLEDQVLCAVVPPGAPTGRLVVETVEGGTSIEEITFAVTSGPEILDVIPSLAAPGVPITIIGGGFGTSDTGGEVEVMFAGSAQPTVPASVRDHSIEVTVPNDASTGPVRVLHPVGDVDSPRDLRIDDGAPILFDFSQTLVEAGDTLSILGRNLEGVAEVRFSGGVTGTNSSSSFGVITTDVPAGVEPGPVTVTVAAGQAMSPLELDVLERHPTTLDGDFVFGGGLSSTGESLFMLTTGAAPQILVADSETMTMVGPPVPVPSVSAPGFFAVAPDGLVGVIIAGGAVHVVEVTSGFGRGTCPLSPNPVPQPYPLEGFDDQSRYAFFRRPNDAPATDDGFLRVDLADGSCEFVFVAPYAPPYLNGLAYDPSIPGLVVSHGGMGIGQLAVDGAVIVPFVPPAAAGVQLFLGLATGLVYSLSWYSPLRTIEVGGRDDVLAQTPGIGFQTRNRRWLFVANHATSTGYFADLVAERVAKSGLPSVRADHIVTGASIFFIDTDTSATETITRFDIRD